MYNYTYGYSTFIAYIKFHTAHMQAKFYGHFTHLKMG
jgi:hypothetical protein